MLKDMKVDPRIFREYDIRGIAGKEFDEKTVSEYEKWYGKFTGVSITPEVSTMIGRAYGTLIRRSGGRSVVVGYEKRPFAEEITESFVSGVLSTGCNVRFSGISLTPLIYFATAFLDLDGGVNITGSHNIYFFNGFKLMSHNVDPIYGEKLQLLKTLVEKEDFEKGSGVRTDINIFENYRRFIKERFTLKKKFKVVCDCGNGSAGLFGPKLLRDLGCEVIEQHTKPDATFPYHIPDPEMEQNMQDLMARVKSEKADLGIAFDADGDRVGFVDEKGTFINADEMLLVLSKDILKRFPGSEILFDVKCTQLLFELIPKYGGRPLIHKTGHAPIKETLRHDPEIILGGEMSGHFYHVENYFKFDDGLYTCAVVLKIIDKNNARFSELFKDIEKRIQTPEIKLPCPDEVKFRIVSEMVNEIKKKYEVIAIDGVRFYLDSTSWGLLRASNTSPHLTIRVEAKTVEKVLEIKRILADMLEKYPEISDRLNRDKVATLTGRLGWV